MPQIIKQEDGTELEVYTKEEVEATTSKLSEMESEMQRLQQANGEMSLNFKRYRDMTEEEKATLTESEKQANLQMGIMQDQIEEMKKKDQEREEATVKNLKQATIDRYTQGNAEMKEKMEKQWDLVNIDVKDSATATERGRIAFLAAGGVLNDTHKNPLFTHYSGDVPTSVPTPGVTKQEKSKEFISSDRGQAALRAMGSSTE